MKKVTKEDLILWKNFSIQKAANGKHILVLICDSKDESNRLMELLETNSFELDISINEYNHYVLKLSFIDSEYYITHDTKETKNSYPLLAMLENSLVNYISTGIWLSNGFLEYKPNVRPISKINLN
jgi:hypothetical protein